MFGHKIPILIIPSILLIGMLSLYVFYLPPDTDLISYRGDYLIWKTLFSFLFISLLVDVYKIYQKELSIMSFSITFLSFLIIFLGLCISLFLNEGCFVDCK